MRAAPRLVDALVKRPRRSIITEPVVQMSANLRWTMLSEQFGEETVQFMVRVQPTGMLPPTPQRPRPMRLERPIRAARWNTAHRAQHRRRRATQRRATCQTL